MSKKIYLMKHSIPEKIKIETSMIPLSAEGIALAGAKSAEKMLFASFLIKKVENWSLYFVTLGTMLL